MATKLKIYWDGEAPGLKEHRLSLNAFGRPLQHLDSAIRSIAGSLLTASESFTTRSRRPLVDLQLSHLGKGSLEVELACELAHGQSGPLFIPNYSRVVVRAFLYAVNEESHGRSANRRVHKFLSALPKGLSRQRYSLIDNNVEELSIDVGEMILAETPSLPRLVSMFGRVTGVGFEAQHHEVRIQDFEGKLHRLAATPRQVEEALDLRALPVKALGTTGSKGRLLWIRRSDEPPPTLSPEDRLKEHLARWEETLRRLAK